MKDYSYHKKVIDDVIAKLNELDIDLYLIITAEGCDPMTSFIPGVDTVGSGACYTLQARVGTDCLTAILGDLLKTHGIQPLVNDLPAGVIATARYDGDGTCYLFLLNSNREGASVVLPDGYVPIGSEVAESISICTTVELRPFTVNGFVKR